MAGPALTREEVIARLRSVEAEVRAIGVPHLVLFGSFVTGGAAAHSDVDVLVEFYPKRKTYDAFLSLWELLEGTFGRPVDLVSSEGLSPYVGPHILAAAKDVLRAA